MEEEEETELWLYRALMKLLQGVMMCPYSRRWSVTSLTMVQNECCWQILDSLPSQPEQREKWMPRTGDKTFSTTFSSIWQIQWPGDIKGYLYGSCQESSRYIHMSVSLLIQMLLRRYMYPPTQRQHITMKKSKSYWKAGNALNNSIVLPSHVAN